MREKERERDRRSEREREEREKLTRKENGVENHQNEIQEESKQRSQPSRIASPVGALE